MNDANEKPKLEDGLYQAQAGRLRKIEIEEDGLKKIRVAPAVFEAIRGVQKQMRGRLGGRKPDVNLVAEALLMHAAQAEGIEETVREYIATVFSGSN